MPTVASFNGVTVIFRFNDHLPQHFHAFHGDREAAVGIAPVAVLSGSLPTSVRKDVLAWAERHASELMANWQRCQAHQAVQRIPYP